MSIDEHPLFWRWNDEKHVILPKNVLSQMTAVEGPEGEALCQRLVSLLANGILSDQRFERVTRFCADQSAELVSNWLREEGPSQAEEVFIFWRADIGIRTSWEVFTSYWDSFCYPMEDVFIAPKSLAWALFYFHEEEFQFGHGPKG